MAETEWFDIKALAEDLTARVRVLRILKTESLRAIRREFSKRLAKAPPHAVIKLARRLLGQPGIEHRFVPYELVCHHRAALRSLRTRELEQFGRSIDNWAAVDAFALYLAGPAWRENQVPDRLIHQWARSRDRWWRRAALVSTVALNSKARGGRGDTPRTLKVCRMLARDRDDMVVKALSWALRELAKRDPKAVRRFLVGHEKGLAARVKREVRNKLLTGLKNPRRK